MSLSLLITDRDVSQSPDHVKKKKGILKGNEENSKSF